MTNTTTAFANTFSRYLRIGTSSIDYGPTAAAALIDALAHERDQANARIRELETLCLPSVQAAERTGYSKGFRAATMRAAQMEPDPDMADAIANLQPDYAMATEAA